MTDSLSIWFPVPFETVIGCGLIVMLLSKYMDTISLFLACSFVCLGASNTLYWIQISSQYPELVITVLLLMRVRGFLRSF